MSSTLASSGSFENDCITSSFNVLIRGTCLFSTTLPLFPFPFKPTLFLKNLGLKLYHPLLPQRFPRTGFGYPGERGVAAQLVWKLKGLFETAVWLALQTG